MAYLKLTLSHTPDNRNGSESLPLRGPAHKHRILMALEIQLSYHLSEVDHR